MMDSSKRIVDKAEDLFFRYGIRSISMDDIAVNLGMSKKTIYKHFINKDELVTTILKKQIQENVANYTVLCAQKKDAVLKLYFILLYTRDLYTRLNTSVINDLRKYHISAYEILNRHKNEFVYQSINQYISEGIIQHLFRNDFNIHWMSIFFMESVATVSNANIFLDKSPDLKDLADEIFGHMISGITTPEGIAWVNHKTQC
jgi:AcrR family transcriptional regulator